MRSRRGRTSIVVLVGVACFATGAGLVSHRFIRSPADIAAATKPPEPSVITARVVRRRLSERLVERGTVGRARTFELETSLDPALEHPLVTRVLVRTGSTVRSGRSVLEVAGRPVVVIEGSVPAYRDLGPGAAGRDVFQLQRAIEGLGFSRGADPRGVFGRGTARAVAAWFRSLGYSPAEPSLEELDALDQARAAVREAEVAARAARRHARAIGARQAAARADALDQVSLADAALADARRRLRRVRATTGVHLRASEVRVVPVLPAKVAAVGVRVGTSLDKVQGPLLKLVGGPAVVHGVLAPGDLASVRIGASARVEPVSGGRPFFGRVASIGGKLVSSPEGTGYRFEVRLRTKTIPAGTNVTVVIEGRKTRGRVLVVPVTAIHSHADARTEVLVAARDRSGRELLRQVGVRAGLSADGYVHVTPLAGHLAPGDEVVVGS
jgi:HlyD family secretion protein